MQKTAEKFVKDVQVGGSIAFMTEDVQCLRTHLELQ